MGRGPLNLSPSHNAKGSFLTLKASEKIFISKILLKIANANDISLWPAFLMRRPQGAVPLLYCFRVPLETIVLPEVPLKRGSEKREGE